MLYTGLGCPGRTALAIRHFFHSRFAYGNKLRSDKLVIAGLSSTTALITGPPDVVDYIVVYTGAEYDFLSDSFVLPCPKHGQFPEMVFEFDGAEYRVPDIDYIRQVRFSTALVERKKMLP